MNCSKSANAGVRADAVRLFSVLPPSESAREEIVGVLKSGKTGGVEHRAALYAMLASTPAPMPDVMPLILKETSDANLPLLASLLPRALREGSSVDTAGWAKEMGSSGRVALRKALAEAAGEVFWTEQETASGAVAKFAEQVVVPFGAVVKATSSTTLPSPLEAYVALAVLLGGKPREPFGTHRTPSFLFVANEVDAAKSAPSLSAVLGTSQKPGFLVLDKIYTKLNTAEEERWLLRAAQAATTAFSSDLTSAKATEHRFVPFPSLPSPSLPLRLANRQEQTPPRRDIPTPNPLLLPSRNPSTRNQRFESSCESSTECRECYAPRSSFSARPQYERGRWEWEWEEVSARIRGGGAGSGNGWGGEGRTGCGVGGVGARAWNL